MKLYKVIFYSDVVDVEGCTTGEREYVNPSGVNEPYVYFMDDADIDYMMGIMAEGIKCIKQEM